MGSERTQKTDPKQYVRIQWIRLSNGEGSDIQVKKDGRYEQNLQIQKREGFLCIFIKMQLFFNPLTHCPIFGGQL